MAEISGVVVDLQTRLRKFKREWGIEYMRRVIPKTPRRTGALQGGYGFDEKKESIELYNTKDYATHIEFGTAHIAPVGMMRATFLEGDEISEVAAKNAGMK